MPHIFQSGLAGSNGSLVQKGGGGVKPQSRTFEKTDYVFGDVDMKYAVVCEKRVFPIMVGTLSTASYLKPGIVAVLFRKVQKMDLFHSTCSYRYVLYL